MILIYIYLAGVVAMLLFGLIEWYNSTSFYMEDALSILLITLLPVINLIIGLSALIYKCPQFNWNINLTRKVNRK